MTMMTRKDWASREAILQEVADVPENWLRAFAVRHPTDCRKFATTRNGSMMYRVEAVLKAIENGEGMPNAGVVERDENGAAVYGGQAQLDRQGSEKGAAA
jgi:hypothetical protein